MMPVFGLKKKERYKLYSSNCGETLCISAFGRNWVSMVSGCQNPRFLKNDGFILHFSKLFVPLAPKLT